MAIETMIPSDVAILDYLRKHETISVTELVTAFQVTPTAVRQRLTRLLAQGLIGRNTIRAAGRGRPSHLYVLTEAGRRKSGANFADLAIALWQEIREISDPVVRRGLIQRISKRLASVYAEQIQGDSLGERMDALALVFSDRRIPFDVDRRSQLPVLQAHACPYPELAEQDRAICAMERLLFSELLGTNLKLSECRLDGDSCCKFEAGGTPHEA